MPADPNQTLVLGIRACSEGEWRDGLTYLSQLEHQGSGDNSLPSRFYSYFGHAVARCEGRRRDGIAMCLHAVEREPFQPVNYLNLARSYLLVRNRRKAMEALQRGLAIDATHRGLLHLRRELGLRRRRPIPFLARENRLNRFLGLLRADLKSR